MTVSTKVRDIFHRLPLTTDSQIKQSASSRLLVFVAIEAMAFVVAKNVLHCREGSRW